MAAPFPHVHRRLGPDSVVGVVRPPGHTDAPPVAGFGEAHPAVTARTAVDFGLETPDALLAVSMRGNAPGSLADGDLVEVDGTVCRDLLLARKVYNHTTGTLVEPVSQRHHVVVALVLVAVFLALVIVFVAGT